MTTFGLGSIGRSLDILGKAMELQATKVLMESASNLKQYNDEANITKEDLQAALAVSKLCSEELF